MTSNDLAILLSSVQDTMRLQVALLTKMQQREAQMANSFNQHMERLREQVQQTQRQAAALVEGAGTRITQEARGAVGPVAAEYNRAVATTSAELQKANRTVFMWFAVASGVLLLLLLVGWMVLGYYRRELAAARDELGRYENAIPVVQAFAASDAVVCDGRICVNVNPNGKRQGDQKQYRPAKPRPQ